MLKSESTKKALLHCPKCNEEFPAQGRERYKQIVDVVRENQDEVADLLLFVGDDEMYLNAAKLLLSGMRKMDRDALLLEDGVLTSEQIELLK